MQITSAKTRLDWVDGLKAFAILGILLNHAVESFHSYPWFTNPSADWPPLSERIANIFPSEGSIILRIIQFLGWLGDMGPGVFILLSGLTLTISFLKRPVNAIDFYKTRALRIYPLYISIHLIILFIAIVFFQWNARHLFFSSIPSILGLRFTNSLFGFLNPSWWFIWLILQMYLVFPALMILLKKKGQLIFLAVTLAITVASRLVGILGYTFNADLYNWMTGLFGGTRLFEFAFGMSIGSLIYHQNKSLNVLFENKKKIGIWSLAIYILGFALSWTYSGSLISNSLVSIGLSGLFYVAYKWISETSKSIEQSIIWIGKKSFVVFLLHQPFYIYTASKLDGNSKFIALTFITIAVFVLGNIVENYVQRLLNIIEERKPEILKLLKNRLGLAACITAVASTVFLSFMILFDVINVSRYVYIFLCLVIVFLLTYRFLVKPEFSQFFKKLLDISIIILIITLFFNPIWLNLLGIFLILAAILLLLTKSLKQAKSVALVITTLLLTTTISEKILKNNKPTETRSWGELPALQKDSSTVYSLIPNKSTNLRYNNYDYVVKTNSLGFTSPEIDFGEKKNNELRIMILGDAFSMPEGLNYEFSYPYLLEKQLRTGFSNENIQVINAGVTGYGPLEEIAQLKKYISIIKPDLVINQLFINEFSDINVEREARLLDIGLIKEKLLKRKLFSEAGLPRELSSYANSIIKSNSDDSYRYYKSLLILYEKNSPIYNDSVIAKLDSFFLEMNRICMINSTQYIVLGVPGQLEVSDPKYISYFPYNENLKDTTKFDFELPLRIFDELCAKNDILYLNSRDVLKKYENQPVYFEESWHWNKEGHKAIANYLTEYLRKNKYLVDAN